MNGAKLKGAITNTGGRDAAVTVYWGDNNASTTAGNWDSNANLGSKGAVALAHDVAGLSGGTVYYYAFKGDNTSSGSGGEGWSPVQSFTTPTSVSAPILGTLHSVTDITSSAAKLNVNLQSTGGDTTTLKFYWGDNDGGTTAANWDNTITISNAQPGNLIGEITSGLSAPTVYYYRAMASNWVGDSWAAGTTSFTPSSIQTTPTRSANLVGWWKFDDDTDHVVRDSSGNNNHGLLKNSSHANTSSQHKTDTPFGTGKAIDLNGNHYVLVSTTGQDTFDGGNQFTIALWVKEFPDDAWDPWVSKRGENSQGWQIRRYSGDQKVSFTLRGPGGDDALRPVINVSNWTHLAGVWGGGKIQIFADGQLVASENRSGGVNVTESALVFGAKDNSGNYNSSSPNIGNYANSWLDDVRFYNAYLSATEISQIYGNGKGDVGQPWISVTSAASATAATGMAFTYQITATNGPTSFSLTDAPAWMSVNAATGTISGTPTAGGVATFKVGATNANGTDFKQVAVTIGDNAPFEYSMELSTDYVGMTRSAEIADATLTSNTPSHTNYAFSKAFDQDKTTDGNNRWQPRQDALPNNVSLNWQFKNPFRVTSYKIRAGSTANRYVKAFILYGSNNGSTWTNIDDMNASSSNHQTNWAANEEKTFTVDSAGDYSYYKFVVTEANASNNYMEIREIDLIGVDYSPITDFNLPIVLDENNATFKTAGFRHSLCQPNGEDLRFQSSSGTELKYEIASWNQSGKSIVWVNLPTLARNDKIIMRWGNSGAASPSYVTDGSAWSSYLGVYHLDQAQDATAPDAGPHNNNLSQFHATQYPQKSTTAILGGSYSFGKNLGNGFSTNSVTGSTALDNFSTGMWMQALQDDTQDWAAFWAMKAGGGNFRLITYNNTPARVQGETSGLTNVWLRSTNNAAGKTASGEWNHIVVTGKSGKLRMYINGVENTSANFLESSSVSGLVVGRGFDRNSPGMIQDEITFHKLARHERWIHANYESQRPGNSYVNYGTLLGPPFFDDSTTEIYAKKNTTISAFTPTAYAGGTPSYSAAGLPPGISINSATGQVSGSTDEVGASSFTVTITGANAAGESRTASKTYNIKVSDPDSFPYKANFTLSGYAGSSSLTNFPVLLTFDSGITGFSYNSLASATAGDLRFYAATGEELPYEIESWDITGTSRVWVRVPVISGTSTVITAAWGDSSQTTAPSYVFDGSTWSNGYEAAWHFQNMSGVLTTDSSSNNRHLTAEGGATTGTGQVGNGIVLDGSNDQFEAIGYKGVTGSAARSTEAWIKTTSTNKAFMSWGQDTNLKKWVWGTQGAGNFRVGVNGGSRESNVAVNNNAWRHVAAVFPDNATQFNDIKFYVDGVETGYANGTTSLPVTGDFLDVRIGNDHGGNRLNGSMDEAHISSVARSSDWIKASYDNQKSSSNFVTRGTVSGPRIVTSPLASTASVGTSYTYNTAAVGSPSGYTILNLPAGLQFNPSNGQVTGTPTISGFYPVSLVVNYSDDDGNLTDSDSNPDQLGSLFPPENPGDRPQVILNLTVNAVAPTITTTSASSILSTKASFGGNVSATGGDAPDIKIYYGTSDGGTTSSSWTFVKDVGKKGQGAFTAEIGDLIPSTAYHYRVRAYNSAVPDGVWASSSVTFNTGASNLPVVNNGSVLNATGTSITMKGGVSSVGTGTIAQGSGAFSANRYPNLKLWLDANDTSTMDKGTNAGESGTPSNNQAIGYWADKSGTNHHAKVYQNSNNYKPKYLSGGMNSLPTVQFDGSNDHLLLSNGRVDFNKWDKMTVFIVYESYDTVNWRRVIGNTNSSTGGWCLMWRNNNQFTFRVIGTGGNDDLTFTNQTRSQEHLISLRYDGAVRSGTLDGTIGSINDTGTIPDNPLGDFVIGGCGRDSGIPGNPSKSRFSEILIYYDALEPAVVEKMEGYLAHKWGLTSLLRTGHAYSASAPTFDDPVAAVDLTLYWGTNDGGQNPADWENEVALGRFHKEQVDVNGFNAYGYYSTWRNENYLKNLETLRALTPDKTNDLLGNPARGGQQDFRSSEIMNVGLIDAAHGNQNWMTLFMARFKPPTSGNYQFGLQNKNDRHTVWLDLDQDGVFEGGSATNGASGDEMLQSSANVNFNGNLTSVALTGGQEYLFAHVVMNQNGPDGGSELQLKLPGGSMETFDFSKLTMMNLFKIKGLSNGKFTSTQSALSANAANLVSGNKYYYRIKGTNSQGTDWADSTASFVSENALDTSTGTLTFNTSGPTPSWSSSAGTGGNGQIVSRSFTDASSNTVSYNVAKFDFDRLNIGDGVSVSLTGTNPLEINVAGDATILSTLDANGTEGKNTSGVRLSKLGGGHGGHKWASPSIGPGAGPAHLTSADTFQSGGAPTKGMNINLSSTSLVAGLEPGGGSYAGIGGRPEPAGGQGEYQTINATGGTYGNADITHLLAGSGGGGGYDRQGGGGGGAIKIVATGTLTIGGNVWACGGRGGYRWNEARRSGGSGSGGAIYLKGNKVVINSGVTISAAGGGAALDPANGLINSGNSNNTDGGGGGAAAGGGGRVYLEATTSLINNSSSTNANLSAAGGIATNRHGTDGTVKILRPQVSKLVFTSGTLVIDTSMATITHSDGSFLAGQIKDKVYTHTDGTGYPYKVCIFTADEIDLGAGVLVTLQGANALSLRTRGNGDFTLSTQLVADGADATGTQGNSPGGVGKLGGYSGGKQDLDGTGPGKGATKQDNDDGTGGGYGNFGLTPSQTLASYGAINGDLHISDLLGGSGGAGGDYRGGGAGGGAIELIAHGAGTLKLNAGSRITVNGGDTNNKDRGGGGGAGGSIRLQGGSIENNGVLQAQGGGLSPGSKSDFDGSGGRIAFDTNGTVNLGNYDLSGHAYNDRHTDFNPFPAMDGTLALRGDSGVTDLSYTSGTLTIDTSAAYWVHSGGDHGEGVIQSHDDGGILYKTCTFTFNSISLSGSVTVVLKGDNSLVLKTQSNGNIVLGANLNADAIDANFDNTRPSNAHHRRALGKLGGYHAKISGSNTGEGPGKGQTRVAGVLQSDNMREDGGGGGYGSAGQHAASGFGQTYGSASLAHLHGGSSGGSGSWMGGGAGGGAISLEAHGDGNITIQSGVTVSANGSTANSTGSKRGGGGSGGLCQRWNQNNHSDRWWWSGCIQFQGWLDKGNG